MDHLFFQENSENIKDISPASHHGLILPDEHLKANPLKQQVSFPTSTDPDAPPGANTRVFSLHNPATKDLLSGLYAAGIERFKEKWLLHALAVLPQTEKDNKKIFT